jgi:hypothetical protein
VSVLALGLSWLITGALTQPLSTAIWVLFSISSVHSDNAI